jgi:hypothetical protein
MMDENCLLKGRSAPAVSFAKTKHLRVQAPVPFTLLGEKLKHRPLHLPVGERDIELCLGLNLT